MRTLQIIRTRSKRFGAVAPLAGIDHATAQSIVGTYADMGTALRGLMFRMSTATNELELAADLHDGDEMRMVVQRAFGVEQANEIISKAHAYAKTRAALVEFLEASGPGNHPSALFAFALVHDGVYALSPDKARAELQELTKPKGAYNSSDPQVRLPAVMRAQVLMRIVAEGQEVERDLAEREAQRAEAARRTERELAAFRAKQAAEVEAKRAREKADREARERQATIDAVRRERQAVAATAARDRAASRPGATVPVTSTDPRAEADALLRELTSGRALPDRPATLKRWHELVAVLR